VSWLLWLYPRAWRRRYGDEYLALIEQLGVGPGVVADALVGALGAHLETLRGRAPEPLPSLASAEVGQPAEPPRPSQPRPPLALAGPDQWESVLDQLVRQARERGAFDNLAGAGRPLPADENPFAGEWELAFRFVRQAGETLPWIALGREIEAERARLDADLRRAAERLRGLRAADPAGYLDERARARDRYLAAAAALDARLAEHARLIPHPHFDRGRLTPPTAAHRFESAVEG
jgi:hypothetical protein